MMKNMNIFFIILLWSCCVMEFTIASSEAFMPSFMQGQNSKIFMIEETDEECQTGCSDGNCSGKTSVDTMKSLSSEEKKQQFLHAIKSNKSNDLMALINADIAFALDNFNDQDELQIPFYVADKKEDLFAFKYDLPFEVYQRLIASGGGLTTKEYTLLYNLELESMRDECSIENLIRKTFVQAIINKDIELVKALCEIDTCLRYQDFLHNEITFRHGPLIAASFDNGMTVLHYAVKANSIELVDFFIKNRVAINARAFLGESETIGSQKYKPSTPLDFAMIYREEIKKNDATPSIEFDRNRTIIDRLISCKADLKSNDPGIQQLIHNYMTAKIQQPSMRKRLTMYQSMSNLFSTNSAKINPI